MGILDILFGRSDKSGLPPNLARLRKKVTNKYGQPQDRQHAIKQVAMIGGEDAVRVLLERFSFSIDQSIVDEDEKKMVHDELVKMGEVVVKPILEFLEKENAPYWPLRVLRQVIGDEACVTHLLDIINRTEAIFDRDVERKVLLVQNLRQFKDPRVKDAMLNFLKDENEEIRVQAIEGLFDFGQQEMSDVVLDRLLDPNETQRVRTAILNLLIEKKWKLKQRKEEVRKVIPPTFWIDDVGVIHRR